MSSWINITTSSGTRTVIDDPLEAGEEFLEYVFDRLEVRLWCKPARMRRAVPSSEVFNEHVIRDRAVLLQTLRGRNALNMKLYGSGQRSGEEGELKPPK